MNKIKLWFMTYQLEITWFIIGWCIQAGLTSLQRGDGIGAMIDFGLAYLNYKLNSR